MDERKERIREFLARFFRNYKIRDDEDIFSFGFVNSLLALQLVNFVETQFGVSFEANDLDLEDLRTVSRIEALVERKQGIAAEA